MAEFMMVNIFRHNKKYRTRKDTSEHEYKELYRFKKEHLEWIAEQFLSESYERRGGALSAKQKMRIFLFCVGNRGFQIGAAEVVGVNQSTVSKTFTEVADAIKAKAHLWIKFPETQTEIECAKNEWKEKNTFPDAIGVVDCLQVTIKRPSEHGYEYVNSKGESSINVLTTCNSKGLFTSVDASWPGSVHDSYVWKNSSIYKAMSRDNVNTLLLGDQEFGIAPWIMTPYEYPVTDEQKAFNACLVKESEVIKTCFKQLKQRFRFLNSMIRLATEKVPTVILCCMVLHNISKFLKDEDFEDQETQDEDVCGDGDNDYADELEEETIEVRRNGQKLRDKIAKRIYSGQV